MDLMLKNNVLAKTDGFLSGSTFTNVVNNGLRQNQFNWTEKFINEYKDKIKPEARENVYEYSLGIYYLVLGRKTGETVEYYKKSLNHLSRVKTNDYDLMTGVKEHQIEMHYYFNDYDNALAVIDSYRHYLSNNNDIPKDILERFSNYLKVIDKLIKIKMGSKIYNLRTLKHDVISYKQIEYRRWFLKEIEELENKEKILF